MRFTARRRPRSAALAAAALGPPPRPAGELSQHDTRDAGGPPPRRPRAVPESTPWPTDSDRMPPLAAVQAALHRITESLAIGLARADAGPPRVERARMAARARGRRHARRLAAARGALRWQGPPHWATFLAEQRRHTLLRQQRIEALLATIDERSRSAGIAIVALKGAALQRAACMPRGSGRWRTSTCSYIPPMSRARWPCFSPLSYRDAGTTWKHQGFDPPGDEQPCHPRRARRQSHQDRSASQDQRAPAAHSDGPDGPRLPAACAARPQRISPRRRVAGARVGACGGKHDAPRLEADSTLRHRAPRASDERRGLGRPLRLHGAERRLWWAAPAAHPRRALLLRRVPRRRARPLERGCPWVLRQVTRRRRLADFSYSHLYIDPLPGVLWARSATQALRYVSSRILPSREQRQQMQVVAKTAPWSAEPVWHRQSQGRRILQWLSSRPTRTETLQPVRAALARALLTWRAAMQSANTFDDTRAAFDSVAANYDGPRGNNALIQDMRREMWRWLDASFPSESHLLDLGCGTGLDAVRMAEHGHRVVATDWSPRMVERTHGRASDARLGDRVRTAAIGAHELERLAGSAIFDGVYSNLGALNCVPDLPSVSRECSRLLKPGGRLVFTVIGRWCPWEIASLCRPRGLGARQRALRARHDARQDERAYGVDTLLDARRALSRVCAGFHRRPPPSPLSLRPATLHDVVQGPPSAHGSSGCGAGTDASAAGRCSEASAITSSS